MLHYKTTITDNETGTIAVINTHEPVKTITVTVTWNDENNKDNIRPDKVTVKLANGTTAVSTKEINNDSWKHVFENIIVFNGSDKVSYTVTQDAVSEYTTEIKASDDGNTIEIINTHVPVAPPKEEPKQEETLTPPTIEIVGFLGGAARFITKPCLKQRVMRFPTVRYGCSV